MTGVDTARLEAIRQRVEQATAAPWTPQNGFVFLGRTHPAGPTTLCVYVERDEDTDFIAHAREDIPYLLAVVARLTDEQSDAQSDEKPSDVRAPATWQGDAWRAFEAWAETADYTTNDPGAPHTEAFFGGYEAGSRGHSGESNQGLAREATDWLRSVAANPETRNANVRLYAYVLLDTLRERPPEGT